MAKVAVPEVAGFSWSGVESGIKANGELDLGLLYADQPATTAAVLTRNQVKAAPVLVTAERARGGVAQAVLVNSGNANACTGRAGALAVKRSTAATATALGIDVGWVLPASTGVIGQPLPAERIVEAMPRLVGELASDGAARFARAIMTTDRFEKIASAKFRVGRQRATLLGIAKGAGMIHPDMATTLAFVVTDAAIQRGLLRKALRDAVDRTFNRVSVDGDTSTNDTIVCMASGALGNRSIGPRSSEATELDKALAGVLGKLAEMLVADGEGTEHVAEIQVVGAAKDDHALQIARTIATSPLVKTAMHGQDPNWGRLLAAAGRAGVPIMPEQAEVRIGHVVVARRGTAVGAEAEARAHEVMRRDRYTIRVRVGRGPGKAGYVACDLGPTYIRINADYRS